MRAKTAVLTVMLALIALGGCSDRPEDAIPSDGPWTISASSNNDAVGISPAYPCFDDEAVSEWIASADMPGSSASGTIDADRTTTNVQRTVDCVKRLAPDADVAVTSRAS